MKPGARIQAAIDLLGKVGESGRPADSVISAFFRERRYIGSKDRASVAAHVYSVLRCIARLDWWLDKTAAGVRLDDRARVLAAMALDGRSSGEISTFCSGEPYEPAPLILPERLLVQTLAGKPLTSDRMPHWVRLEYPPWLHGDLRALFGEKLEEEMAALNAAAPVDLRVNPIKGDREKALEALANAFVEAVPLALSPLGIRIEGRPHMPNLEAFRSGLVEIQDEGSQVAALLVGAKPGMRVADFCAGAGGKTLAMAASMDNRGHVVAMDTSKGRLDRAAERLRRAGAFNVERRVLEGERDPWVKHHKGRYDRVLVDAPCTGTGTWRRNPDARWRLKPEDIAELVELQRSILDSACRLTKPGGRLVYVTCSLLAAENEEQVAWFAAGHPEFTLLPIDAVWAETIGGTCPHPGQTLRLSPAQHGCDGFFVAVFERQMPNP